MTEIAIYVEGGGPNKSGRSELRQGFDALFADLKNAARRKRLGWKLSCFGGRDQTFEAFANAIRSEPRFVNVLLVDSEGPIPPETNDNALNAASRVALLALRDHWNFTGVPNERVHLMTQCTEAWIVADPAVLTSFYGQGFRANLLPGRPDLEDEPKADLHNKLKRATRATRKGEYDKIAHGSQLLRRISPTLVAARCRRFATFRQWLGNTIAVAK